MFERTCNREKETRDMKIGKFRFFRIMPLHAQSKPGFYWHSFNHETIAIGFKFPLSSLDIRVEWK
jgi:hypothetical protein